MINTQLEKSPFFHTKTLKKGELLYDEGEKDNNLYVVKTGKLQVSKYLNQEKTEKKILAVLEKDSIFGEGGLSNNDPKEVCVNALEDSKLLYIKSADFEKFITQDMILGKKLLKNIIEIGNKRLLESNFLLTSYYDISKMISEKTEFSNKSLFEILDEILKIFSVEYIVLLEKNPVMKDYLKIEYDTRVKGKLFDTIIRSENFSVETLKEKNIVLGKYNYLQELKNKNEIIGYILIGEGKKEIGETQKKAMNSLAVLIAGFMKQKQYFEEEKNRGI